MLLFYGVGKLQGPSSFVGKLLVVAFVGNLTGRRFSVGKLTFSLFVGTFGKTPSSREIGKEGRGQRGGDGRMKS